jgi:hypothetical protein
MISIKRFFWTFSSREITPLLLKLVGALFIERWNHAASIGVNLRNARKTTVLIGWLGWRAQAIDVPF